MDKLYEKALFAYEGDRPGDSLALVNEYILNNQADWQGYLLRARICYRMQKWGEAMNDYLQVLEIDSQNQDAKAGVELTGNILSYFTPDMFNP